MRSIRCWWTVLAIALIAWFGATEAVAQGWSIQSADYGVGKQHVDVTNAVRRLAKGPRFKVDNVTLGVNVAGGASKTLRITARSETGQLRDFTYAEGAIVNATLYHNDEGAGAGDSGGVPAWGGGPGLHIISAVWGSGALRQDVAGRLQGMVSNNRLSVKVNTETMGSDPAPGVHKVLTVVYEYQGKRQTKAVAERNILNLP
jgi:hypothetical protein